MKTAYEIAYSFMRKIRYDHVSSFAGHAALFILMSLFPMAIFCVSVFQYLPLDAQIVSSYIMTVIPEDLKPLMDRILQEAYTESTTVMVKSVTMLVMLFCASKGVYAVLIGMNAVYGIRETRNIFVIYLLAIVYVVAFFAMLGLMMLLIVLGNHLFNGLMYFIPQLGVFQSLFGYGKYLCMLVLLMVFFLTVYMTVPNRKSKLRYELLGAVFYCGMAGVFMGVFVLHRALCQLFRDVWQSCRDCNFYFMALWDDEHCVYRCRDQCGGTDVFGVWLQLQTGICVL